MNLGVVEGERVVDPARFEEIEREVPPVVHREHVPAAPIGFAGAQERDALVDASLHLVHVGDRVDRPHVLGMRGDGGEAVAFRRLVVARLLEAEGEHPLDEPEVGARRIDAPDRAGDTIAEVRGVAAEEVELMPDEQREQVVGPFDEQVVESASGAVPVTADPALDRGAVRCLVRAERQAGQVGRGGASAGEVGGVGRRQRQVRGEHVAHRELGLLGDELGRQRHDVRVVAEEPVDGEVVGLGGFRGPSVITQIGWEPALASRGMLRR